MSFMIFNGACDIDLIDECTIKILDKNNVEIQSTITTNKINLNNIEIEKFPVKVVLEEEVLRPQLRGNTYVEEVSFVLHKSCTTTAFFEGCTSLKKVDRDLFKLKADVDRLSMTFKDCESLDVNDITQCLSVFLKIKVLDKTFENTGTKFITSDTLNVPSINDNLLELNGTFMNSQKLISISSDAFNHIKHIMYLLGVFKNCYALTSAPYYIFKYLKTLKEVRDLFITDIEKEPIQVNPNFYATIPEKCRFNELFNKNVTVHRFY